MNAIVQSMSEKNVTIKNRTFIHTGFCPIEFLHLTHQRFDGSWTPEYTREVVVKKSAVGALPYDPKHQRVVLIEQFRPGALGQKNGTPWSIEIVAGIMDKDHEESGEDIVQREMHEEACLEIEALIPICNYFSSPGYSTEKLKLFCAKVDSTKAPKFCGLREENEDIKIHVVTPEEAFAAVRSGQINNAATIIALQWLELNLEAVNSKWGRS
jgi:ADP-ribose pyrophosphatase